ncbi:hypothetical protein [Limimaricola soesokkakensis]|uniref:hypothetical protein n=1 Tax=Limimaricola soesokkakensis TaxID=1343159 RepID=UPI003517DB2C
MTQETESQPSGLEAEIAELVALLEAEIAEIRAGDLAGVTARLERKSELAARIEAARPEIEAGLAAGDDAAQELRERLDALADLIARDAAMLERMRATTGAVARDLERLRDRHGLGGLYGANGNRSTKDTLSRAPMDKSV